MRFCDNNAPWKYPQKTNEIQGLTFAFFQIGVELNIHKEMLIHSLLFVLIFLIYIFQVDLRSIWKNLTLWVSTNRPVTEKNHVVQMLVFNY